MGTYVSDASEVQEHMPYRKISATTDPSETDVNKWIVRAEGQLTASLRAGSITTPITDTEGIATVVTWLLAYLVGLVEKAYASAGGDPDNDKGIDACRAWEMLMKDIPKNTEIYKAMLCADASGAMSKLRSHVVNSGLSEESYTAKFTREDWENQF